MRCSVHPCVLHGDAGNLFPTLSIITVAEKEWNINLEWMELSSTYPLIVEVPEDLSTDHSGSAAG